MVTIVIAINLSIALICLCLTLKLMQLQRILRELSVKINFAERRTQSVLAHAPAFILQGHVGSGRLRQQIIRLKGTQQQLQHWIMVMSLFRFAMKYRGSIIPLSTMTVDRSRR